MVKTQISSNKAVAMTLLMIGIGLIDTKYYPLFYIPIWIFIKKYNLKNSDNTFDIADIGVIIIVTYELLSLFMPGHFRISNQIESTQRIIYVCFFWFFFRLCINDKKQINYIIDTLSVVSCIISLLTIFAYYRHKKFVGDLGMDDMISFRPFYHPLGQISNDWVTILLCLLPWPVVGIINSTSRKIIIVHFISYCLVVVCILISFSRGAYLALLLFVSMLVVLGYLLKCEYRKTICKTTFLTLLFALVTLYSEKKHIISTCMINHSMVQKQSIQGRITKWNESMELFKMAPIWGVGNGNYDFSYDIYIKDKRSAITKRSTNTYLQILVEKGVVGTVVISICLLLILIECLRFVHFDKNKIPFLLAIMAVSFRESVFSSFYVDRRMPLLCVLLLLLLIQCPIHNEK